MTFLSNLNKILIIPALLLTMGLSAQAGSVAAIDVNSIYLEYSLVKEANEKFTSLEEGFKRILATAEKEMKDLQIAGDQTKLATKKKEIQGVIDDKVEEMQDAKEYYDLQISKNIQNTMNRFAKSKNLDVILNKVFVINQVPDLTQEFLTNLERNTTIIKAPSRKKAKK